MFQSLAGMARLLDPLQVDLRWKLSIMLDVKVPKTPAGLWKTTEMVEVHL